MRNIFRSISITLGFAFLPIQFIFCENIQAQTAPNRKDEADQLLKEGQSLRNQGKSQIALEKLQQALIIYRQEEDRSRQITTLYELAHVLNLLAQRSDSVSFMNQAIQLSRDIGDKSKEASLLVDLGWFYYFFILDRDKGIGYYKQALSIYQTIGDLSGQASTLTQLGWAYYGLGETQKSLDTYNLAIKLSRESKNQYAEASALLYISQVYTTLNQQKEALDVLSQSREIYHSLGVTSEEARVLRHLGGTYASFGDTQRAIDTFLESLSIYSKLGIRVEEGYLTLEIGRFYQNEGNISKAIEFMSRSLYIRREVGERSEEARILSEIGSLLQNNKQPELAILFYKQSVNVIEGIRKNLENLSEDDRKAYTTAVASNYRILADLLIKQDRILEAQQVLDLLKVQELSDYFRSETVGNNAKKADYQLPEQNIIALGIELDQLQKLNPLTIEQKQRIAYLTSQEIDRNAQFNTFLNSLPVQKQIEQLRRDKAKNVDLEEYNRLREILKEIKNAVIFYPLILDDRLELILITDSNTPIRKTTYIKREDLNKDISDFLISLRNPSSNAVQADAQKFYRYLIEPFEKELQDAKIETIIYAPDGQLRYIPLAALYDGKQWLVERYRINNITASSLTNLRPRPRKPLRVLAAAATTSQNIKFGDTSIPFVALPATRTEVEAISALIPTTVTLFDQQFNKIDTLPKMQSNSIVHLATHGYFAIGKPEDSFIVFGDGDKATIADMKNWTLTNVELVVLSACETAIGSKVGSGIEIFGLGYQIHNAGAGAAIASLWKVSDGGTQKLMDAFYTALKTGKVSNIEALQQAQVAMITGNSEGLGEPRGQVSVEMRSRNTSIVLPKISHPYYWAAFILIGNGL